MTEKLSTAQREQTIADNLRFIEARIGEAAELIDAVDAVIDSGCPVREYNRACGELLEYARERGKRVITSLEELTETEL